MNADLLINFLKSGNYLTEDQEIEIVEEVGRSGKDILKVVEDYGILNQDQTLQLIAESLGTSYIDVSQMEYPPDLLAMVPPQSARVHDALPVEWDGTVLRVAIADPLDLKTIDDLQFATGQEVQLYIARPSDIHILVERFYGSDSGDVDNLMHALAGEAAAKVEGVNDLDAADTANAAPIVKYVNTVLSQAIKARASDIHFEPFETEFKIRYRVDGALYEMAPPPRHLAQPITARIKVLSNLNISEHRIPQDGRIQTMMAGRPVDLRVSCLPTQFGESVVLRVLDRTTVSLDLEKLGMPDYVYDYIVETIHKPNGIFIVTGPTGSGKTTTLYSCLRRINTPDSKLLTAEDPVEYEIEGIQQVPINDGIDLTFARVLRAFLRQDPDRIMIGETRDLETAQIAIQASLTGHLVFTTLHTNDSAGAIARLIDMGVEPFLISSTLEGILAQRLLRRICTHCRMPFEPTESVLEQLGLAPHEVGDKDFYYGNGCEECNQTGYRGRKGIYELLDITEPIRELINQRAPSVVIRQKAIELGMATLRADGMRSIFDGDTTIEEVLKYT
ncbi:MAG: GspE/PulE family protein [Verrucomicrobiota bacterium]